MYITSELKHESSSANDEKRILPEAPLTGMDKSVRASRHAVKRARLLRDLFPLAAHE